MKPECLKCGRRETTVTRVAIPRRDGSGVDWKLLCKCERPMCGNYQQPPEGWWVCKKCHADNAPSRRCCNEPGCYEPNPVLEKKPPSSVCRSCGGLAPNDSYRVNGNPHCHDCWLLKAASVVNREDPPPLQCPDPMYASLHARVLELEEHKKRAEDGAIELGTRIEELNRQLLARASPAEATIMALAQRIQALEQQQHAWRKTNADCAALALRVHQLFQKTTKVLDEVQLTQVQQIGHLTRMDSEVRRIAVANAPPPPTPMPKQPPPPEDLEDAMIASR